MKAQSVPARIPETMGPDEIGPYLRSLREQFKLTPQDVSERLHIRVRYVNAIEEAKYENMPGKVYARGYVHTYSEFLGLDPEQVVTQCFPPVVVSTIVVPEKEAAPVKKAAPIVSATIKPFASAVSPAKPDNVRLLGIGGAALVTVLLGYFLFSGSSPQDAAQESAVAEVPEEMLASVRNEIMPAGRNYVCLTTTNILSCFLAQNTVQQLQQLHEQALHPYAEDFSGIILTDEKEAVLVTEPEEKASGSVVEEKPAEIIPAEVKPATEAEINEPQ